MLTSFLSNKVEALLELLKERLYASSGPFTRRIIIVPSRPIQAWLTLQLASDTRLNAAMGIEVLLLNSSMDELGKRLFERLKTASPSALALSLSIEHALCTILETFEQLSSEEKQAWDPVVRYLRKGGSTQQRMLFLSKQIADLFRQYGHYGLKMVQEWSSSVSTANHRWQQFLWNHIFSQDGPWKCESMLVEDLLSKQPRKGDYQFHLFPVSFLSGLQQRFFQHIAAFFPLHCYVFSPCKMFWEDLCTDSGQRFLEGKLKEEGASKAKLELFSDYLNDRNPLLANWGRLGRSYAVAREKAGVESEEWYRISPSSASLKPYIGHFEQWELEEDNGKLPTLLSLLQADILVLRNPQGESPIEISREDSSLRICRAFCRLREVQGLYEQIVGIMARNESVKPSDILVMAPDILCYEPYIRMVFGGEESLIDYQLLDLKQSTQNSLARGFLHLLSIPLGRWDVRTLLKLFEHPAFRRRHQLLEEDLDLLRLWMREAPIFWGLDSRHRKNVLESHYGAFSTDFDEGSPTWQHGIARLLSGLIRVGNDGPVLPYERIGFSEAPLLGKLIEIITHLKEDLGVLASSPKLTLSAWTDYLRCLFETYFLADEHGEEGREELQLFYSKLNTFSAVGAALPTCTFSFSSVFHHFQEELASETAGSREGHVEAVRFCSMLPMRSIPSKVICLLGMDEDSFPRKETSSSMNALQGRDDVDYCPARGDYDRYLFLEALLSAREHLLISYVQADASSQGGASVLVDELFTYVESAFSIDGQPASKYCQEDYPAWPFDAQYFSGTESSKQSYSKRYFRAAQTYYAGHDEACTSAMGLLCLENSKQENDGFESIINIKHLIEAFKQPQKLFFQKSAGVFLEKRDRRILEREESFTLPAYEKASLRKKGLIEGVDAALQQAAKEGKLPPQPFKDLYAHTLKEEIGAQKQWLEQMEIEPAEMMSCLLSAQCAKPQQLSERAWHLPALTVHCKEGLPPLKICGLLEGVTTKGLFTYQEHSVKGKMAAWIPYLVYLCHPFFAAQGYEKALFFGKSCKAIQEIPRDREVALKGAVHFTLACQEKPFPYTLDDVEELLEAKIDKLKKRLKELRRSSWEQRYSPYADWLFSFGDLPIELSYFHWDKCVKGAFASFIEWVSSPSKRLAHDD